MNDWRERYREMVMAPAEAVARLKPGNRVFIGTGCAEPIALVSALTDRAGELADVEIVHLLTMGEAPYADRKMSECFRVNSFFIAENVRGHIQEGLGDYTPIMLSDIPRLFHSGQLPLDAALVQVSEPDERGKMSLGISVDIVRSAVENASLVIAQVNPRMPRTVGESSVGISDLDILVPVDAPLLEVRLPPVDDVTRRIGEQIASLVENGSTIEFGIGRIPHAVVEFLKEKEDLGIHTEMFSDSIVELLESGAVTGARKSNDRGKVTASFCMGTRRLYSYVDGNPLFRFRPTEHVNDPAVIGSQFRMVAINTALEVDLTGQVCADSLGTRFYSGIGGQVDFNRGAARSDGGKAIIALPSTARSGEVSRIVPRLSDGAGVVTTRGDVHYVVTEYGIAYLHGKSVQERSLALIGIAHPDFRPFLVREALQSRYIRRELASVEDKLVLSTREMNTTFLLDDGTQVTFRPVHPTDEGKMRDLLYHLSQETIFYRFMANVRRFHHQQIQDFVYIDHRKDVAIVGTLPEAHGEEIVAVGRYYLDEQSNRAEVAFVVRDEWQGRHIGRALFSHLVTIAKRNGISGFTAEVLRENRAMQAIFNNCGCRVKSSLQDNVYSFRIDF
ncbi:GNAT family N-acetyltransferase [Candidatus Moduliflexota bacterium]